jgi:ribosomal protein S7
LTFDLTLKTDLTYHQSLEMLARTSLIYASRSLATRQTTRFFATANAETTPEDPLDFLHKNTGAHADIASTQHDDDNTKTLLEQNDAITPVSANAQEAIERVTQRSILQRFTAILAKTGNQGQMEEHLVRGLFSLHQKTNQNPAVLFAQAVTMLAPVLECGSFRRGAKIVRVPLPVTDHRGQSYAMRWMRDALRKRRKPPVPFEEKFVAEVLALLGGTSPLLQKKAQMHRDALVNRSMAPQRWGVGYKI